MVPTRPRIQSHGGAEIGMFLPANPEGTPSKTSEVDSLTYHSEIRNRNLRFLFVSKGFSELQTIWKSGIGTSVFHFYVFSKVRTPNDSEIGSWNFLNNRANSCPFRTLNSEQFTIRESLDGRIHFTFFSNSELRTVHNSEIGSRVYP